MQNDYYININNQSYKYIEQWIQYVTYNKKKNKKEAYKQNLLITGSCGIGKTIYLNYLLQKYEYTLFEFNLIDFKHTTDIKQQIKNILGCKDISTLFTKKKHNKVIIINQLDQFNTTEKNILQSIIDYIAKYSKKKGKKIETKNIIPIVFMSNKYKTFFKSFKKYSMSLSFPLPSEYDISCFSKYYIKKNNISISEINLIRIQNSFPPNYKKISDILDLIHVYVRIHKKFNLLPIQQIIKNNSSDLDIDIYQSAYQLLTEPVSLEKCGYIMSKDTKYISLLLHTNFPYYLHHNTKNTYNNKLNQLLHVNSFLLFFSKIIRSYTQNNSNILLYQYVNYTLSKICNLTLHDKKYMLEYSSYNTILKSPVISKLNYKFCNIKYIREICNTINIDQQHFQIFAHYLYYLFSKYEVKKYKNIIIELLTYYKFSHKDIDKIFKLMYIYKIKKTLINYSKIYTLLIKE